MAFCNAPGFLMLWSKTYGSGKSYASAAIMDEWLRRDIHRKEEIAPGVWNPVYYHEQGRVLANGPAWKVAGAFVKMQSFFATLKAKIGTPEAADMLTVVTMLQTTPLLVMDDFCRAEPTAFENDIIYRIVDDRTNRRLPFVATTNAPPSAIAQWVWGATASRLKLAKWEHLDEIDYRAELKAARSTP